VGKMIPILLTRKYLVYQVGGKYPRSRNKVKRNKDKGLLHRKTATADKEG